MGVAKIKTQIYQICYSHETLSQVPPGFFVLDNLKNERADWREYWPMRNFLLNNNLSDNVLYGFFSPKFSGKTGLGQSEIEEFLKKNYADQDVVNFSPYWDMMSIFKNVFEQGDYFHPGLGSAFQEFSDKHLAGLSLSDSFTHSQNSIFCNYFLAKKKFWVEWLELAERMFSIAESNDTSLGRRLNEDTTYGSQRLPLKVFFQERLATACLVANPEFRCLAYGAVDKLHALEPFIRSESAISDALKIAYAQTGDPVYLSGFAKVRNEVIARLSRIPVPLVENVG